MGQEAFGYFALFKVTRRKGGTISSHNRKNGYAPKARSKDRSLVSLDSSYGKINATRRKGGTISSHNRKNGYVPKARSKDRSLVPLDSSYRKINATRPKGGTISSRDRRNGYLHSSVAPPTPIQTKELPTTKLTTKPHSKSQKKHWHTYCLVHHKHDYTNRKPRQIYLFIGERT